MYRLEYLTASTPLRSRAVVSLSEQPAAATVDRTWLRPFSSAIILECAAGHEVRSFETLVRFVRSLGSRSRGGKTQMISAGLPADPASRPASTGDSDLDGPDQLEAVVFRKDQPPGWATADSPYTDRRHFLVAVLRRRRFIAVHCEGAHKEALQRWLDKEPRPPLRRASADILQGAFLKGEAKGLWLRGTHSRRTTKADSKNISGRRLQDALSPFEDSSVALGSARSASPDDPARRALTGVVGMTPRKAQVWNKPSAGWDEFVQVVMEALTLIEETAQENGALDRPFPVLAVEGGSLADVRGAYDISVLASEDLSAGPDVDENLVEAASLLQEAVLDVHPVDGSPDFTVDVGRDGSTGGTLRGRVRAVRDGVRVDFGLAREPINPAPVRQVLDALQFDELITVYYDSGHAIVGRNIWRRQTRIAPFPRWAFHDFNHYDISQEKPDLETDQSRHDAIGLTDDRSLFSWVAKHFANGWLTCDDGAGEIADFVHLSDEGVLSLIHVKGAKSRSPNRRVAVGPYEVVSSQAEKNLVYLDPDLLCARLKSAPVASPACWTNGLRTPDRTELAEMIQLRGSRDESRVVIVQPHVSAQIYNRLRDNPASDDRYDVPRLHLLETMLNASRSAATGLGAEFDVFGSLV